MLNSEWTLFLLTYLASSLTALSPVLLSSKPLSFRLVLGTIVMYGGLGSGFGMTIGYEYLGGKQHPLRIICCGMLVGAGAIKKKDIVMGLRTFLVATLRNALGVIENDEKKTPRRSRRSEADTPNDDSEEASHD